VHEVVRSRSLATSRPVDIAVVRRCWVCGDPAHGKPRLVAGRTLDRTARHDVAADGAPGALPTDVSLAGVEGWALVAIADSCRTGADIEPSSAARGMIALPPSCFSARERSDLERLPPARREAAITRAWVRKEALAKLDGRGLAYPLSTIETRSFPGGRTAGIPEGWVVRDLPVPDGLVAAVALDDQRAAVVLRTQRFARAG
jgi:4'-phosphopantetheinyl transferase